MSFSGNVAKIFRVHRRKTIAIGGIAGLVALQYTGLNPISNIMTTPGVRNIEKRYSSGGGSYNHLPGSATPLGNSELVDGNTESRQGVGSEKFKKVSEQKPDVRCDASRYYTGDSQDGQLPSGFDKAWNKTHYGAEKGK
ncbi:hypothetical protein MMC13_006643 [Lambiella insularis]|nr:hypothetical protein [Lambiella insularis]